MLTLKVLETLWQDSNVVISRGMLNREGQDTSPLTKTHLGAWSIIEKMYDREVTRIKNGQCARIPKLKQSHIHRDSWTRLNVLPSKVMQVI